jgi:RNA polymerase sigma factor (sigma-70 family)
MMSPNQNFDETVSRWIELVKDGDKVSFERLWERYFTSLVGLAKKNMARHAVRVADEEDVVQSALASFYFRAQEGRYPELNDRDGFWKLLMSITLNKARAHARKEGRRSEILEREFSGDNFLRGEPAPELALEMSDQLERLLQKLEDDLLRQIAVAKLEGCSNQEIADRVGKSIPTVERKLRLIRTVWGAELLDAA